MSSATASPSSTEKSAGPGGPHDDKYRDAEKGVKTALEEEYGSRLREDLAEINIGNSQVEVVTTWNSDEEARWRGIKMCRTVSSYVHEHAPLGQFNHDTQVVIYARGDDSIGVVAYLDVPEGKCKMTKIFIPDDE
ncbi:hypothetical protein ABZ892_24025 [Streptomyces sp. NPDC046924]|uniref:hypothetical protein n=1 Tax=Streptomyces sp. NPDC046924 TaxID=3155136 RepID=UPI0033E740D4